MTQEEKAKAYDKVREKIAIRFGSNVADEIFSQFEMSEDEKVRKNIIIALKSQEDELEDFYKTHNTSESELVSWLEKQSVPNPYSGTSFKYDGHIWGMCIRDNGVEITFDGEIKAFLSSEKSFIYPIYPQKSLTPKSAMEAIKEEKVDNQNCVKDVDNVEQKIRVGDWIIRSAEGFKHNTYLVTEIKDYYGCEDLEGRRVTFTVNDVHKNFKLWNISDAKDGDVLACNEEILLFKSYSVQNRISLYCWYNGRTNNFHSKEVNNTSLTTRNKIYPATKEQRDLLFQKMKEAGYRWNPDEKKLEKIESADEQSAFKDKLLELFQRFRWYCEDQTPTNGDIIEYVDAHIQELIDTVQNNPWSEDDEIGLSDALWAIKQARTIAKDENDMGNLWYAEDWLKSLRPQNNYNPYKEVVESIAEMCKHYDKASHSGLRDFYDNVKVKCRDAKEYDSLFPQNTWKPSDEQMKALRFVKKAKILDPEERESLNSLYIHLKKLK